MNCAMREKTEGREESIDGSGLMDGCFREVFSAAVVLLACPYWAMFMPAENPPFPASQVPTKVCGLENAVYLFY